MRETEALAKHWQSHSKPVSFDTLKQVSGASEVIVKSRSVTLNFASEEDKERFLAPYQNQKA